MWRKSTGFNYPLFVEKQGAPVKLQPWIENPVSLKIKFEAGSNSPLGGDNGGSYTFKFLNLSKKYKADSINWNEPEHGALWTYNLNYMDYLLQPGMDKETGLQLINNFIQNLPQNPTGPDPYPIAIRSINWIKFLARSEATRQPHPINASAPSKHRHCEERPQGVTRQPVNITQINSSLFAQYNILLDNPEYHLLANHLLEDSFSLLFGAFYFNDSTFYNTARQIIETELNEQILDDGAHFELSPMYHQIILDRLLDCINLVQNNQRFEKQETFLNLMQEKAKKMLAWLNTITFSTGEIPLLNDAAPGIAPTTRQLNQYASTLNFKPLTLNLKLSASGYRKFTSPSYECIIDIGQIGPPYQPGHAHADTFNFVLNVKNKPVIVDTGISTYNAGGTRLKERGTAAHNTVTVQDKNSSEVWSSFRVARRAKVTIFKENESLIKAFHNGFRRLNTRHLREWIFSNDTINIKDRLKGKITEGKAHLILAPGINPELNNEKLKLGKTVISFINARSIEIIPSKLPSGYNAFKDNVIIEIVFKDYVEYNISLKS